MELWIYLGDVSAPKAPPFTDLLIRGGQWYGKKTQLGGGHIKIKRVKEIFKNIEFNLLPLFNCSIEEYLW